jgi:hypothetical protein
VNKTGFIEVSLDTTTGLLHFAFDVDEDEGLGEPFAEVEYLSECGGWVFRRWEYDDPEEEPIQAEEMRCGEDLGAALRRLTAFIKESLKGGAR